MASLDVDSLFTNIPLKETIDICCELVFKGKMIVDGMSKEDLRQLLTLATTESFILFNNEYYQQTDGVAMGSPLGPTLANIFLGYNERIWLEQCPPEIKPEYFRRYVDDIFLLFKDVNSISKFKDYMNKQHKNMNFTSEYEVENSIPFLDVHVVRNNCTFFTSVYRKPTFSGVYTNYNSFLPTIYKSGLVSTLLYRCYQICTSWTQINVEIKTIKSFMLKNGYPENMLDRVIYKFLDKMHTKRIGRSTSTEQQSKQQFQLVLPHLGKFTKQLETKIKKTLNLHFPEFKVIFIYKASTRLRNLFRFKDPIPKYLTSNIIYQFQCNRCNSIYIGESIRHTKKRFSEHLGLSALTGKTLKGQNSTTVKDHIDDCKPNASMDDFRIIGRDNTSRTNLRIKESLFIHRDCPSINIQGNSIPLVLFTK